MNVCSSKGFLGPKETYFHLDQIRMWLNKQNSWRHWKACITNSKYKETFGKYYYYLLSITLILAFDEDQEELTAILFYLWTPWALLMDSFIELIDVKLSWTVWHIVMSSMNSCIVEWKTNIECLLRVLCVIMHLVTTTALKTHFRDEEAEMQRGYGVLSVV